jgi:hypothetical protein
MKLAIMQPYFFPYIGYFQLMNAVDKFVVFDDIQYIRHGWINRNRILSPNLEKEWQYFNVPLAKHSKKELIKNIKIVPTEEWKLFFIANLGYYKKIRAPYYNIVLDIVKECIYFKTNYITELNLHSLEIITKFLNIQFDSVLSSTQDFNYNDVNHAGDWAFEISKQMNASVYINPIGGEELFNRDKFINRHMKIKFIKSNTRKYKQSRREFVPSLSIIDVMMFNSPKTIKIMLDEFELK